MKSLRDLYRIGPGPSSSHTIGPHNAAKAYKKLIDGKGFDEISVTFYGSLAFTGIGHHSDHAIKEALKPYKVSFVFDKETKVKQPLTMLFETVKGKKKGNPVVYYSLGGGALHSDDDPSVNEKNVYPFNSFDEVKKLMEEKGYTDIKQLCLDYEDEGLDEYLEEVIDAMIGSVERGLEAEGRIPGGKNPVLNIDRSAKKIYEKALKLESANAARFTMLITAYAYAVSEGSACGETIVTAPTCGSSGILPACLYYYRIQRDTKLSRLRDALYTAGMIGNLVKQNASIAGSIGGCQAEVGTAASMAAAAITYLVGGSMYQIEYAAECAMEHFLGLTCDPVDGYVIIPCIERNGIGAARAFTATVYAMGIAPIRGTKVSFDNVVKAMKVTGDSIDEEYKETGKGGLAQIFSSSKNC